MHEDQLDTSVELVRALIAEQHPQWRDLPIVPVDSTGTVHALYRLGDSMLVRLPFLPGAHREVGKEVEWLPVLAPQLPLTVPTPLARGIGNAVYPYRWSVYEWLEGDTADRVPLDDPVATARALGEFVLALQRVDTAGAPPPGPLTSWRGASLSNRDQYVRDAIGNLGALDDGTDTAATTAAWDRVVAMPEWDRPPVWFHGDLLAGNLLVVDGRLRAIIDWGCCGTGDPAVEALPAWSVFDGEARAVYRDSISCDDATWERGRGWALSGALLAIPYYVETNPEFAALARRMLDSVLTDPETFA
jgi:aminoglycoside phosphotransferase (APT) family kinase protein